MKIRKIDTKNKRDINRFIFFPYTLYRENKLWVPPFISAIRDQLNTNKHPYYLHSTADFFLAEDARREVVGRIALLNNKRYNEANNIKAGHFSLFEVVEDNEIAQALIDTAVEWGKKQGLEYLIGPKGMLSSDVDGILIEGFEHRPAMGVPYNYPYYQDFIEDLGFIKERDVLSGYIHIPSAEVPKRIIRVAERIKKQRGFWVKQAKNKNEMRAMVPEFMHLLNTVFDEGFGFYPYTEQEFFYIAQDLIAVCDPDMVKVVMKGEKMIGFLIAYHDLSRGIKKAGGRIWPIGWLHIMIEKRRTKVVNVNGVGVLPEYQGLGVNAVLYAEMAKTVLEHGFEHIDTVSIGEENYRSFSDNQTMGVKWYKKHRLYKRKI